MSEREFEIYLDLLVRMLRLSPQQRDAISQELRAHMEERLEELTVSGVDRDAATRRALEEFGDAQRLAHGLRAPALQRKRRMLVRSSFATVAACAVLALGLIYLMPANREGVPVQPGAWAQENAKAPAELERENERLRQILSHFIARDMRGLATKMYKHEKALQDGVARRPSDFRDLIYWQDFVLVTDPAFGQSMNLPDDADGWAWADLHTSFDFPGGKFADPKSMILVQRHELIEGRRWAVFGDGRAELLPSASLPAPASRD